MKDLTVFLFLSVFALIAFIWYENRRKRSERFVTEGKATTTRYWDCSRPTCSWNPNCGKRPISVPMSELQQQTKNYWSLDGIWGFIDPFTVRRDLQSIGDQSGCCANNSGSDTGCNDGKCASPDMQLAYDPETDAIYGTAAVSGSFNITPDGGQVCGKCFELALTGECGNPYDKSEYGCNDAANRASQGKKLTVMATNLCPNAPACPKSLNIRDRNVRGASFHFDLAIPGGGVGDHNNCSSNYNWDVKNRDQCSQLPEKLRIGCETWYDKLNGADNPMVTFKEVNCPKYLTDRLC